MADERFRAHRPWGSDAPRLGVIAAIRVWLAKSCETSTRSLSRRRRCTRRSTR